MKESVRAVVARFFNVPEAEVTESFVLPPERLQGSIARRVLHAAIKRLADEDLPGVWNATTFGELTSGGAAPAAAAAASPRPAAPASADGTSAIGIDIEQVGELPWSGDPWSEPFYAENFTEAEKAYAMRQGDPRQTLCGMWCAKEAALKCGPDFAGLKPRQIEVTHDDRGRPHLTVDGTAAGCEISISHSCGTAVAVCSRQGGAVRLPAPLSPAPVASVEVSAAAPPARGWIAILLSIVALALAIAALLKG